MPNYKKTELAKALRWYTGDSRYNFSDDYLHILSSEDSINKLINSYRFYTKQSNS